MTLPYRKFEDTVPPDVEVTWTFITDLQKDQCIWIGGRTPRWATVCYSTPQDPDVCYLFCADSSGHTVNVTEPFFYQFAVGPQDTST